MVEFGRSARTAFDNKGQQAPDVVGALRIDQAWGYAQVSAALHDASGGYYGAANSTLNGHPSDKLGGAVSGGFTLNDILGFKGDTFGMQACYSVGAAGYCTRATGAWQMYSSGNNAGFGWVTDGVYDSAGGVAGGTNVELTTVWGINGYAQHLWSPKWRTSLYGGYVEVDYNGTATTHHQLALAGRGWYDPVRRAGGWQCPASDHRCGGVATPARRTSAGGRSARGRSGTRIRISTSALTCCGRTSTPPTRAPATLAANGARPAGVYAIDDQDIVSVMFRIQRNFLP